MVLKEKTCKECKKRFAPQRPLQYLCCPTCAFVRTRRESIKKQNRETLEARKELKTLSEWKADLQVIINAIVRLIDYGQPCIATGNYYGKMNAGHYISVGSNATLRFHLDNIHIQSEHSNSWKGGDTIRYQDGIVSTYGIEYLEYMNSLKSMPELHLTIDEVKVAIKKAREVAKELRRMEQVYSATNRLLMRRKFNKQIGIYG